jgi:hypothetical protein
LASSIYSLPEETATPFAFPAKRVVVKTTENSGKGSPMPPTEAITAFANRNFRLVRMTGWAVAGAAAFLIGWPLALWLDKQGLDFEWKIGSVGFSLEVLLAGLFYSGALGVALWRAGHAGWRRAAGFALLAMFWFDFGLNAISLISSRDIMMLATGLFTAGLWVTLASLLFLPDLRRRENAVRSLAALFRLLAVGVAGGTLAGVMVFWIVEMHFSAWWGYLPIMIAAWGAVYAAALCWALPPARHGPATRF